MDIHGWNDVINKIYMILHVMFGIYDSYRWAYEKSEWTTYSSVTFKGRIVWIHILRVSRELIWHIYIYINKNKMLMCIYNYLYIYIHIDKYITHMYMYKYVIHVFYIYVVYRLVALTKFFKHNSVSCKRWGGASIVKSCFWDPFFLSRKHLSTFLE